jgi:hypothetical protein
MICTGGSHPYQRHEGSALFHTLEGTRKKSLKHAQDFTSVLPSLLNRDGCINISVEAGRHQMKESIKVTIQHYVMLDETEKLLHIR